MSLLFDKPLTDTFPDQSYSITHSPWEGSIRRILKAAFLAVDPYTAIRKSISIQKNSLRVKNQRFQLSRYKRIRLIGMGKACIPMALAIQDLLGDQITDGLLVVKDQPHVPGSAHTSAEGSRLHYPIIKSSHPVPDERSQRAGSVLKTFLQDSHPDDLVICLVSGGGSALVVSPVTGVDLNDIQGMTRLLLTCGATIQEINILRKHLDEVKGGGLARWAFPATLLNLVLSDVLGDPLDVIASGPGYPDTSFYQDAWNLLEKYQIVKQMPARIVDVLSQGLQDKREETPKPGDPIFSKVVHTILGNNRLAANAALKQAKLEGYHSMLLTTFLQGEARQAGIFMASIARELAAANSPLPSPACLVVGGETTVTLTGDGVGGRNQELALGAVTHFAGLKSSLLITLATDGEDGPTDAAGAVVTGDTQARALNVGMNPMNFLANNDSYHFFKTLEDLIVTGPSQTNVNDLVLLFHFNG
jgi:glycerate 2-kinase